MRIQRSQVASCGASGLIPRPVKTAGREMRMMLLLMEAIGVPSVVLERAIHL
jgi:hypothetical protein